MNRNRDNSVERHLSLSRRQFLKGLGACLALPSLGQFAVSSASAKGASATVPIRMAFVYVPNGTIPSAWWPSGDGGADFNLSKTLEPLAPVKQQLSVISGLADKSAEAGMDGAGDHARAGGTFLTGVRIKKTAGADLRAGVSIDQAVASKIGHLTRFPSLELTCDNVRKSGNCDSGYSCAYGYNLSWRSPTQPLTPEPNPRLLFERLFGTGNAEERIANLKRREAEEKSILDFVLDDARRLEKNLDGRDRAKLDQYLTSVREVEQRIERAEKLGKLPNPAMETPRGIPSDFREHVGLMFDMLLLAFQTDSTRVATLMLASEGSNKTFPDLGITEGHHNLSHHENSADKIEKIQQIDEWYVTQFAKFLQKLDAAKDADGSSLLKNSLIVYGSGNADGNAHTHTNLPILLAGSGGGKLRPGRYLKPQSTPLSNLFLTMSDCVGADLESHGDSTGRLSV
jgi:hypothetical protein